MNEFYKANDNTPDCKCVYVIPADGSQGFSILQTNNMPASLGLTWNKAEMTSELGQTLFTRISRVEVINLIGKNNLQRCITRGMKRRRIQLAAA